MNRVEMHNATRDTLVIGVVGNPNCGKTTLFNMLTGARQWVGNWPGVTVERKSGTLRGTDLVAEVVDLPGVYTLGVVPGMDSLDERITRDFILSGEPDVIINIVDASNLERNLYLTAQVLEMRVPTVVAVNMVDLARKRGISVDVEALARGLGCPVVPIVATRGHGVPELKERVREVAATSRIPHATVPYPAPLETAIAAVREEVEGIATLAGVNPRWLAVRLLEGDDLARGLAKEAGAGTATRMRSEVEAELGDDMDILVADGRYAFAHRVGSAAMRRAGRVGRTLSDAIDGVVLHRWMGLPVFLLVMYLMFTFTINLGGAFIDFFDQTAALLFVQGADIGLSALDAPAWLRALLADGLGGGIQVVATFIPVIGFLYLFLSALEDTGYMARAAFLMDRYMRAIGLPGKAFVPLIVGFGCNVPGIMASRTLEQQRDRTMAVLMTPFMSCGARLAVYALFVAAFFPSGGQNVVFILYIIGILAAVGTGFILRHTLLRGETSPFLMELPPYHVPQLKSVLLHTWTRLKTFLFGAGQVIVSVVVVMSFLNSWGTDGSFGNQNTEKSVLSAVGRTIVPAFEPMGIHEDNWPATVGIFTGIFAKEAVVGTLDALYSGLSKSTAEAEGTTGETAAAADSPAPTEPAGFDPWSGLAEAFATIPANLAGLADLLLDPLGLSVVSGSQEEAAENQQVTLGTFGAMTSRFDGAIGAFAYLLFILLYVPCVAALGAVNRELGPHWTAFSGVWSTGLAYAAAVAFYQTATLPQHPATTLAWLGGLIAAFGLVVVSLRHAGRGTAVHPHQPLEVTP